MTMPRPMPDMSRPKYRKATVGANAIMRLPIIKRISDRIIVFFLPSQLPMFPDKNENKAPETIADATKRY